LVQQDPEVPAPVVFCETRTDPVDLELAAGDQLRIWGTVEVVLTIDGEPLHAPLPYLAGDGNGALLALADLDIRVNGTWGQPFAICPLQ
jgi:hypothetical protein